MYGYNTAEYLKDMGTPKRLKEVEKDYSSGKIQRANAEHMQKAIFLGSKINKCRLNSRLNIYDLTLIDIAYMTGQTKSLNVEFL